MHSQYLVSIFTVRDRSPGFAKGWNVQPTLSQPISKKHNQLLSARDKAELDLQSIPTLSRPLITIASGNPQKVAEIEAMLGPLPINVQRQPDELDIEETGSTYLENALLKAEAAARLTGTFTIADDSGLEVNSLGGSPGLYSARFASNDEQKIKKILLALSDSPYRSALFRSVMVLCDQEGNLLKDAEGVCWGELLKKPAYQNGGLESLFWIKEARCTYGELNSEQLMRLGSRGKAARILAPCLRQQLKIF